MSSVTDQDDAKGGGMIMADKLEYEAKFKRIIIKMDDLVKQIRELENKAASTLRKTDAIEGRCGQNQAQMSELQTQIDTFNAKTKEDGKKTQTKFKDTEGMIEYIRKRLKDLSDLETRVYQMQDRKADGYDVKMLRKMVENERVTVETFNEYKDTMSKNFCSLESNLTGFQQSYYTFLKEQKNTDDHLDARIQDRERESLQTDQKLEEIELEQNSRQLVVNGLHEKIEFVSNSYAQLEPFEQLLERFNYFS